MRLFIQIPCLNERASLEETIRDLPRMIAGVGSIELLVIDDGSSDGTADLARALGVHYIIRFPRNKGLAAAHGAGLDACLRLGADIVVNTDADNQYPGAAIPQLIQPILDGRADVVVGDRQTDSVKHFSPLKRVLQRVGSRVVRAVSNTNVTDSTSGFRAMNVNVLQRTYIHNRFTYTLESLIQAGQAGLSIENVKIVTNGKTRNSRLFRSIPEYLRRNGTVIVRAYHMYSPARTFGWIAGSFLAIGLILGGRFFYFYFATPGPTGHVQSLLVAVGSIVLSIVVITMLMLSELIATNRRLLEDVLVRTRRVERALATPGTPAARVIHEGIEATGARPWLPTISAALPPSRVRGVEEESEKTASVASRG